jgi:hypothetical protein
MGLAAVGSCAECTTKAWGKFNGRLHRAEAMYTHNLLHFARPKRMMNL